MRTLVPQPHNVSEKKLPQLRRVGVFGSTGSIGVSALEIIKNNTDRFNVFCLVAGKNSEKLLEQATVFLPKFIGIEDATDALVIEKRLKDISPTSTLVVGAENIAKLASHPECDVVLGAIVGMAGLHSVIAAAGAGKIIALANKESLVCGGAILKDIICKNDSWIIPVDSEHAALFQALQGNHVQDIEKLILTASGGPFLKTDIRELSSITPEQALQHPRWKMGPKVTIDSSTMFNKALELIEAHWLFGIPENQIEVAVHPQSIVHSIIEYKDGSQIAQLSHPDMKGPISFSLSYPERRVNGAMKSLRISDGLTLEFLPLDTQKFPAVELARAVLRAPSGAGVVFNAADEVAVAFFLQGKIKYSDIIPMINRALDRFSQKKVESLGDIFDLDREVRSFLVNS